MKTILTILALVFNSLLINTISAATFTSSQNGSWSSSSTWGGAGTPGSGDNVIVGHDVSISGNVSVAGITINSGVLNLDGHQLNVSGAALFNGGSVTGGGKVSISSSEPTTRQVALPHLLGFTY